jgi:FixJ family two-component response regulator
MARTPLISIIDDDDAMRSSLENLIRSVGLRARGFSSAEEFLSSNQVPETHCLILDVRMPGMSGPELQRQMAVANSHLPIILITAHADDAQRTQALEAGAVAFLHKPFYEGELLKAINAALNHSRRV